MKLTNLKTEFLGRNAIYYKKIDSTQSEIWRNVEMLSNGSLVMSDLQTLGKGTHGRVWHTDEAGSIAFSFLIKMDYEVKKLEGLTLEIAQIIVDIMKSKYKIRINIKEPNDLIINNKKVRRNTYRNKTFLRKCKIFSYRNWNKYLKTEFYRGHKKYCYIYKK